MIVVTGATGALGSQIVERLLERIPADQVGVSVRDPDRATGLAEHGVRVRRGDFAEPDTLEAAFEGADRVLVVSTDTLGEAGVRQAEAAIDAAYRAGACRVLYTSHQAAHPESSFAPARDHAAVEAHLAATGRPYTSLRNGYYTTSLQFQLGNAAQTGRLAVPADGPVTWTSRDDLAEAAAAILTDDSSVDGPTPPLVAREALDMSQVAAILSELSGHPVEHVVVDDEDWVASLVRLGTPDPFARLLLGSFHAARHGEFAVTDRTLAGLLGREPRPVRDTFDALATP